MTDVTGCTHPAGLSFVSLVQKYFSKSNNQHVFGKYEFSIFIPFDQLKFLPQNSAMDMIYIFYVIHVVPICG